MLDEILNTPELAGYLVHFKSDDIIFLEGDDSRDLYVLASGQVAVFKGDKKIRELSRPGSLFGEVSFLLGSPRTASVRAKNEVTLIRIPKEEIELFLDKFPEAARAITGHLAQWLAETSQILYGLKEFCDQLSEAVVLTDKDGKILTWNDAAEKLYGRSWQQMRRANAADIYEEPELYGELLGDDRSQYSAAEKILRIKHPDKGTRFIATSLTVLYDGHHNFQGILSLGRDVTRQKNLEIKYKRLGRRLMCAVLLLGAATTATILSYSYLYTGHRTKTLRQQLLQDSLEKDYFVLRSLLIEHLAKDRRLNTSTAMKNFLNMQKWSLPYTGLLLLDDDRIVIDAYSIAPNADLSAMIGSSYAAIKFEGRESSVHRVLTLYRADKDHPMGKKSVEIAFELHLDGRLMGWLIFQMDMDRLQKSYGIELEDLKELRFENF
jgi:PAS domain S-box-containing protein